MSGNTHLDARNALSGIWRLALKEPRLAIASLLTLFLIVWGLGFVVSTKLYWSSPEGRAETARQQQHSDVEAAKRLEQMMIDVDLAGVKSWLRDPTSAQFVGLRHFKRDGKDVTCGLVNARNGFGGMAGPQAFAVEDHTQVHLDSFGRKAIEAISKVCG